MLFHKYYCTIHTILLTYDLDCLTVKMSGSAYAGCAGTYNLTLIQHNDSPVYEKNDRVLAKYGDDKWGCAFAIGTGYHIKSKYSCKKLCNTY